eukprot:ANDGO_01817.mRNA.1 DNA polymerase kappa
MSNAASSVIQLDNSKAGMQSVDKATVERIIYENSKHSLFYQQQQKRHARTQDRIRLLREKKAKLGDLSRDSRLMHSVDQMFSAATARRNAMLDRNDLERGLVAVGTPIFVHIDMDMFYAAVEIRDQPHLADVPMGVGGEGMLCTSNYKAREFGVRAAMPGFIARKLCPQLVIVRPNFDKYTAVCHKIRTVLATEFLNSRADMECISLDEASLDWTQWVVSQKEAVTEDGTMILWGKVGELVAKMRRRIVETVQVTCSVGVGPSKTLAKICSEKRKPDDQFLLFPHSSTVDEFLLPMEVRKIRGVGKVTAQILTDAFGVHKLSDLYEQRYYLKALLSDLQFEFLLSSYHGCIEDPASFESPKKERTLDSFFRRQPGSRKTASVLDSGTADSAEDADCNDRNHHATDERGSGGGDDDNDNDDDDER